MTGKAWRFSKGGLALSRAGAAFAMAKRRVSMPEGACVSGISSVQGSAILSVYALASRVFADLAAMRLSACVILHFMDPHFFSRRPM